MDAYPGRADRHLATHLLFGPVRVMHRKQDWHSGLSRPRSEIRTGSDRPQRPPRICRRSTDTCQYRPGPIRRHLPTDFDDFFNLPPPILPPELGNYSQEPEPDYRPYGPPPSPRLDPEIRSYSPEAEETSLFHDAPEEAAHWTPDHRPTRYSESEEQPDRGSEIRECVVIDLAENSQSAEVSPVAGLTATSQLTRQAFQLFRECSPDSQGLLLMDVERTSQFPFVTYVALKSNRSDLHRLVFHLESAIESREHQQQHHVAGYEEVAAVDRPEEEDRAPPVGASNLGFIISAFRVFPGEDREKLERHWLVWTGANLIYHRLPRHLGLTRITLHKKVFPERGINYVMVCECATLLDNVTEACVFVDHLRARCCGHTALYRIVDVF